MVLVRSAPGVPGSGARLARVHSRAGAPFVRSTTERSRDLPAKWQAEVFPTGRCGQDSGSGSRCQPAIIAQVRTTSPGTPRSQASRNRTSYSLLNLACGPVATTARPLRLLRARSRTDPDRGGLPGPPGNDHAPAGGPAASAYGLSAISFPAPPVG